MPSGHLVALDSEGIIWWRRWDKKGWFKMESPSLPDEIPAPFRAPPAPSQTSFSPEFVHQADPA